jgi:cytochrome c peroxidase
MLVGRVFPAGPYGWRGESETLEKRVEAGVSLHAGEKPPKVPPYYVNAVAVFLRKGLVSPPARAGGLTEEEQRGKAIFEDEKSNCAFCHAPARYFSNYRATALAPLPTLPGFEPEQDALYKTPSLLHVGHHAPLFHDGSAPSLEDLVEKNGVRMGDTAHLTAEERKALVAYLKTL